MARALAFAHDGSLNGDWVSHYAVRFAANTESRQLKLLHVFEGASPPAWGQRLERLEAECKIHGVTLEPVLCPRGEASVVERLAGLVPPGTTLVTGTRARPKQMAFLAGTVSARLLAAGRFAVVAVRVVHPGVLGQPERVLVPLAGHPRGASQVLAMLALLGPDLSRVHVLHVRELSSLHLRALTSGAEARLLAEGRGFAARVEGELRAGLAPHRFELDSSVVVADDAPAEIVHQARRDHSRLICLGASERSFARKLVSGQPIERVLSEAPCDVAVYGGPG